MRCSLLSTGKVLFMGAMMLYSQTNLCARDQRRETRFEIVKKSFKNPSKSFRSAPLWVWNTNVTTADIDRMLDRKSVV